MSSSILKGISLAILCSFFSFIIHLFISRMRKGRISDEPSIIELKRQTNLLSAVWSITFIVYSLMFFSSSARIDGIIEKVSIHIEPVSFIYGIILYTFLSFLYLSFYYLFDRSISATLLELIYNSPDKKLTASQIKEIYNVKRKYQTELDGMAQGRFIIREGGFYRNSLKGSIYAKIAKFIKSFYKFGPGG